MSPPFHFMRQQFFSRTNFAEASTFLQKYIFLFILKIIMSDSDEVDKNVPYTENKKFHKLIVEAGRNVSALKKTIKKLVSSS